jgi:small neutral amino acid transporter SnatA (MarC family)
MLTSKKSKVHNQEKTDIDEGVAISPLAIPILGIINYS